jgi:glycerophosphoryl diester phosphodiesterase
VKIGKKASLNLDRLYQTRPLVVTAHRGFSSQYPENTLPAFLKAVETGADVIEFDVRGTRERIPIILHDRLIDKTSDGRGSPGKYTLEEIKRFDFCYRRGSLARERWPGGPVAIPTLEEVLSALPQQVGLNIQLKEIDPPLLAAVCRLFADRDLYRRGYFTVSTFDDAALVRQIDPAIELCVLERKLELNMIMLKRMKDFGCRFLQPHRRDVTPELCAQINAMGFYANMYHAETEADMRRYINWGMQGLLTNAPQIAVALRRDLNRGLR